MTVKLIDVLLGDIDKLDLTRADRESIVAESSKAINLLTSLVERFKAIKAKALSNDDLLLNASIKTIDRRIIHTIALLCESIESVDQIDIEQEEIEQSSTNIIVQDAMTMKSILQLIDIVCAQKL